MRFLIWSNEHQSWWRAHGRGYTGAIEEAGRHTREQAVQQVRDATLDGVLTVRRENPVTGEDYSQLSEVMVLAPEHNPGARTTPTAGPVRFGIVVDDAGYHVRFRLFAASGGQHLGQCGGLVMRAEEYVAFRALLGPALTDRADPGGDR